MKEKIRKEYYRRIRLVLKTELNSKNRIEAINTLAVPVVQYSFNIINWNLADLNRLETKTRKLLTSNKMHHPKADVDHLYLPRSSGGRGIIELETSYITTTIGMQKYLTVSNDWMIQLVHQHEENKKLHSIVKEARKFKREFELKNENTVNEDLPATKQVKQCANKQLSKSWSQNPLHGKYTLRCQQADVDQTATHQWLRSLELKAETEGFILAAQDQSLFTRNYQANILRNGASDKCRFSDNYTETVDHLVSGCPVLAPNKYKNRHYRVGQYLHWKICKSYKIETCEHWHEHKPQPVAEGDNVTLLWDFSIRTDRTIQANRPDIIVKDFKEKTCLLIDMSIPTDQNIPAKKFDKLSKYKDLEIEI